jgi:predicted nucleic acid-binding protein
MTEKILIDSSFLYALHSPSDKNYQQAHSFAGSGNFEAVISEVILTEVSFLFRRIGGSPAVALFLEKFAKADNQLVNLQVVDFQRASKIMLAYPKAELDFVDCILMALSERLNIIKICTDDRRDFAIFRPKHCAYLEILP